MQLKSPKISKYEFNLFQELLLEESGLYFNDSSNYSLCLSLSERLKKRGISSYKEYYDFLTSHPEGRFESDTSSKAGGLNM